MAYCYFDPWSITLLTCDAAGMNITEHFDQRGMNVQVQKVALNINKDGVLQHVIFIL